MKNKLYHIITGVGTGEFGFKNKDEAEKTFKEHKKKNKNVLLLEDGKLINSHISSFTK